MSNILKGLIVDINKSNNINVDLGSTSRVLDLFYTLQPTHEYVEVALLLSVPVHIIVFRISYHRVL